MFLVSQKSRGAICGSARRRVMRLSAVRSCVKFAALTDIYAASMRRGRRCVAITCRGRPAAFAKTFDHAAGVAHYSAMQKCRLGREIRLFAENQRINCLLI